MQIMQVQVPAGVSQGGTFAISTPSGQMQVQAMVPEGQMQQVQVPVAQAMAAPVQPPTAAWQQPAAALPPVIVQGFPADVMVLSTPQAVVGIPVDQTTFVTSKFGNAVDPVPMIDAQTAGILHATNKFRVKQRFSWMEGLSQGACEQQNVYDIWDDTTGANVFTAVEESDGFTRCCCAPHHSFKVKFKPGAAGQPRAVLENVPAMMTMEREGCCGKWGLGCCACSEDCKDGFFLHAGDVAGEAGSMKMGSGRVIGFATQPKLGGGMTPTINVMERLDEAGSQWGAMAKIEGPTIFGGCSELCCDSAWPVSKMEASAFETKLKVGDFATITKRKPKDCMSAVQEATTDSDQFTIEFNESVSLAPQQKALMLASLVQIDYMFFEKDNGMCKCENNKLKITFFECYCMGCTCPCNLEVDPRNAGGGAPSSQEMKR